MSPLYRRRVPYRRRMSKPKFLWIRSNVNNVSPAHQPTPNLHDLLETFRTTAGISLNLPDFTIWRLRFKIGIRIELTSGFTSNSGVHTAFFVDNREISPTINALVRPYSQQYMMWDAVLVAEQFQENIPPVGGTPFAMSKEYDIKTHRKLTNVEETLWFSMVETGNGVLLDYDMTWSCLLRQK